MKITPLTMYVLGFSGGWFLNDALGITVAWPYWLNVDVYATVLALACAVLALVSWANS